MPLFRRSSKNNMEQAVGSYFRQIGGYTPTFTTFEGGIYEMELTRAAIHCIATHISKLSPVGKGPTGKRIVARTLAAQPNQIMTTQQYLYRLGTLLTADNNVFIAPQYDADMRIVGYYPLKMSNVEIVRYEGAAYVRYRFEETGEVGALPLEECGRLTQMQYKSEFFGESNRVLKPTLDLMHARDQSIIEGVKAAGIPRFIAKLSGTFKQDTIRAKHKEFVAENLGSANSGGVIMTDGTYEDVKQINSAPVFVDDKQTAQIKDSVYTYFGVNEDILQNKFNAESWNAFYEGKIEPIALQLSMVHTSMSLTADQAARGNEIRFYANRMQYMSTADKLQTVTQLFDRGFITHNQGLEIFDMPPTDDGDKYYIRKEYANVEDLHTVNGVMSDTAAAFGNEDTEKLEQEITDEVSKPLNGEQAKAAVTILLQYINGKLSLAQTVNIFALITGIGRDEAKDIIEAKEGEINADESGQGVSDAGGGADGADGRVEPAGQS